LPIIGISGVGVSYHFEEKVIAVFFIGQLTIEGKVETITKMIDCIEQRFPDCFIKIKTPNLIEKIRTAQIIG